MSRLVRTGQLLKLRTTRTALGFTAAVVVLTLAIVLITILAGDPRTIADKRSALAVGGGIRAAAGLRRRRRGRRGPATGRSRPPCSSPPGAAACSPPASSRMGSPG